MVEDTRMICKFCKQTPKRKINRHPKTYIDKIGCIQVVEPIEMVDDPYYECACGCRYTPYEVEAL